MFILPRPRRGASPVSPLPPHRSLLPTCPCRRQSPVVLYTLWLVDRPSGAAPEGPAGSGRGPARRVGLGRVGTGGGLAFTSLVSVTFHFTSSCESGLEICWRAGSAFRDLTRPPRTECLLRLRRESGMSQRCHSLCLHGTPFLECPPPLRSCLPAGTWPNAAAGGGSPGTWVLSGMTPGTERWQSISAAVSMSGLQPHLQPAFPGGSPYIVTASSVWAPAARVSLSGGHLQVPC